MKNILIISSFICSLSAFGADANLGSVDSLLSVLPLGSYQGTNDSGEGCNVTVSEVNYPSKSVLVIASNAQNRVFKNVMDGSEFVFRAYKKEFIQSDRYYVDSTRTSYVDRVLRTVNADEGKLYVVVANEVTISRDLTIEAVECVVSL